jgi:hypothetical protein
MGKENTEKNVWPSQRKWIRTNQELLDLYRELDMIAEIGRGRIQWLGGA